MEAGLCSQRTLDGVNARWTEEDEAVSALTFDQGFANFKAAEEEARRRGSCVEVELPDGSTLTYGPYGRPGEEVKAVKRGPDGVVVENWGF